MADNLMDTLKYSSKIMVYVLVVLILSAIFIAPGVLFLTPPEPLMGVHIVPGILLSAIGVIVLIGGMFGIQYKVISDGVKKGNEDAE